MPCGILHPMVWGTSVNSLAHILKTINLFLPGTLIFWKATKFGNPSNFPKVMSQLWGIPQPQYFVTQLLEPHWTYFWKHYIYHKEDTKVGSQNLATKFGFVPECSPGLHINMVHLAVSGIVFFYSQALFQYLMRFHELHKLCFHYQFYDVCKWADILWVASRIPLFVHYIDGLMQVNKTTVH